MSDSFKLEAQLAAGLLRAATVAIPAGFILGTLAGFGLLLAALNKALLAGGLFALSAAGILGLLWYGLRIRFDVTAFSVIAQEEITLARFDQALSHLGVRSGDDTRDLQQRALASRKLIVRLICVIIWQLAFLCAGSASLYVV